MHPDPPSTHLTLRNRDLLTSARLCDDVLTLTISHEEETLSIRMDAADAHHLFAVLGDALGTRAVG